MYAVPRSTSDRMPVMHSSAGNSSCQMSRTSSPITTEFVSVTEPHGRKLQMPTTAERINVSTTGRMRNFL